MRQSEQVSISENLINYIPTAHAIERARIRFGIDVTEARDWFSNIMSKAIYVSSNDKGQAIYENSGTRIIVDERKSTIVTVYSELKTDFLLPALERELRKIKRYYTRTTRELELAYAELLREIGDMAINRARARNPKTRELIAERMADKQEQADVLVREIERLNDEKQAKERAIAVIAG